MPEKKSAKSKSKARAKPSACDNTDFLAAMDTDIAARAKQMVGWAAEQARLERLDDLKQRIYDQLLVLSQSGPKPPYLPDDSPPPFHVRMWADRIVSLARDWNEYHSLFGQDVLPVVDDEYGHEAARRLFACARTSTNVDTVASQLDAMLERLHKFGKKVYSLPDKHREDASGLAHYFGLVALAFYNTAGQVWKYNGRRIPGSLMVSVEHRARTSRASRSTQAADPADSEPDQTPTQATTPEHSPDESANDATGPPGEAAPIAAVQGEPSSLKRRRLDKVPDNFAERIMRALPADRSWIHGDALLRRAKYTPGGGRYGQYLGIMARADGPLESRKGRGENRGYRRRQVLAA